MEVDLAALARSLRALERDALARLPAEPLLHAKRVLAEHALEDAASATGLERLAGSGAPDPPPAPPRDRRAAQRELAAAARALVERTTDEARLAALIDLELRQRRHLDELPERRPAVAPAAGDPARDPFVILEPGAAPDPLNDALLAAEAAARDGDPARAAAHMRHAAELDRERARDGDPWGLRPVDLGA